MKNFTNPDGKFSEDIGIGLGIAGIITLIAGALVYGVIPEMRTWALIFMLIGLLSLVGFLFFARELLSSFIQTRQGRYSLNSLILIIIFTMLLVLINFFSSNINFRTDLTATNQFTLAPQTIKTLENLQEPVESYGFFSPEDPRAIVAERIMQEYVLAGEKLTFEIVDIETEPAKARQFQVDRSGQIVFSTPLQMSKTTELSEQSLTATLLRATGKNLKTVCFTTGHGEKSILGTTDLGLKMASEALERELYIVRDFSFITGNGVPSECSAIIISGPERNLVVNENINEGTLIREYLGTGGNMLLMLTPKTPNSWLELLEEGGIAAGGGTIIDPASFAQPDKTTPQIRVNGYFPGHPITEPLIENSLITFFPLTTRVAPLPENERTPGAIVVPLIFTSDRSWLESDSLNLSKSTYNQQSDSSRGANAIATALEFPSANELGQQTSGKIFAIGNAAFAGNLFFHSLGNGDLFINSVNWLTEREDLISIRPKLTASRLLILSQREADWILYSSVGLLPFMVASLGLWIWWKRR
jgi:hypothetical protein